MPLHDWTKVPSGLFHDFHQTWSIYLKMALNDGLLPSGLSALVEQRSGPREADVLAVESRADWQDSGGLLTMEKPKTRFVFKTDNDYYTQKANRVVIKHHLGKTVAIIEIVSPGNKDSQSAIRSFVQETVDFLRAGIHVLVIDLFPPTIRDPNGLHQLIWDEMYEEPLDAIDSDDRVLASFQASDSCIAYVDTVTVGDELPSMPLFIVDDLHVKVPLACTYQSSWLACSKEVQRLVTSDRQ